MRIFFRRIHLYLGLAAGIVITITCLTGGILVFQEELEHSFNHECYYVQPGTAPLPVEQLIAGLKEKTPGLKVNNIKVYTATDRSVEITYGIKEVGDTLKNKKDKKTKNNYK